MTTRHGWMGLLAALACAGALSLSAAPVHAQWSKVEVTDTTSDPLTLYFQNFSWYCSELFCTGRADVNFGVDPGGATWTRWRMKQTGGYGPPADFEVERWARCNTTWHFLGSVTSGGTDIDHKSYVRCPAGTRMTAAFGRFWYAPSGP